MFRILLAIFIIVPALEIVGMITMGHLIGGWMTFGFILLTGFVGAYLAKREGRRVWEYARHQLSMGQVPTESILDGICIFAGGLLLISPGFLTDILGFILVFPVTRPICKVLLLRFIQRQIGRGQIQFFFRR
jgi:UPF0716 protein FxsA